MSPSPRSTAPARARSRAAGRARAGRSPQLLARGPRGLARSTSSTPRGSASSLASSSASAGKPDRAAACADVKALRDANARYDDRTLRTTRTHFATADRLARDLAGRAPAAIAAPAKQLAAAVHTLRQFADQAHSINDLAQTQSDKKLAAAYQSLTGADQKISAWVSSNC